MRASNAVHRSSGLVKHPAVNNRTSAPATENLLKINIAFAPSIRFQWLAQQLSPCYVNDDCDVVLCVLLSRILPPSPTDLAFRDVFGIVRVEPANSQPGTHDWWRSSGLR